MDNGNELKIAVMGVGGRMSQTLRHAVNMRTTMELMDTEGRASYRLFEESDVILDFTTPEASVANAIMAAQTQTPIVIGTTGFNEEQLAVIKKSAFKTTIVQSSNTSIGVNLMILLAKAAANILEDYQINISETHHHHKKDIPSGTAIMLRDALDPNIEIDSLRYGDEVGTHEIQFLGNDESIIIQHSATNRSIFARGALQAAEWAVAHKEPGLYTMNDVLQLHSE